MSPRQSPPEPGRSALPLLWLLSDARNDAGLEVALRALPPGSGFVFRHYHLDFDQRAARFRALARAAKAAGHLVILAEGAATARDWGADGVYGDCDRVAPAEGMLGLATAHDGEGLAAAGRAGVHGVFLSPVFATRSHPEAEALGIHGFHVLAQQSPVPVIALGGMTKARAAELAWPRWGAIDGLVAKV
ncbi:MAG: thiamine phosphate synthase [Qipengyuania sp.]|nr:thiamine phosphate synthase [Qipengyuania sp.]